MKNDVKQAPDNQVEMTSDSSVEQISIQDVNPYDSSPHAISQWYFVPVMVALSLLLIFLTPTAVANPSNAVATPYSQVAAKPLNLDVYKNKVVLVEFWGSWCYQCAHSMSWLNGLQKKYKDKGLVVMGVNLDSERHKALKFQKRFPTTFRTLFDPNWEHAEYYGVKIVPSMLIFDRDGKKVHQHTGFKKEKVQAYEAMVHTILED